jgi:two-component system response regulator HupR/HoxA
MLIFSQDSVLGADLISRHILTAPPQGAEDEASLTAALALAGPLKDRVETLEKRIIRETLIRRKWNKSRAAADLGLSRVGLRAKLDRYGITPPLEAAHEKEEA